jgi:hypothetical protein
MLGGRISAALIGDGVVGKVITSLQTQRKSPCGSHRFGVIAGFEAPVW